MRTASNQHTDPKSNKGVFRRRRLVMLALACFLSWAGVTMWNQVGKLSDRSEKVQALEQKLAEVQQVNEAYRFEIVRWDDPEYVEQQIRKELHYGKEGEILFITP